MVSAFYVHTQTGIGEENVSRYDSGTLYGESLVTSYCLGRLRIGYKSGTGWSRRWTQRCRHRILVKTRGDPLPSTESGDLRVVVEDGLESFTANLLFSQSMRIQ